jgi:hypothetical protein
MKGFEVMLLAIIGGLILLVLSFILIYRGLASFDTKSLEQLKRFKTYKPYSFDINNLIVDPNDPKVFDSTNQSDYYNKSQDSVFCQDLRSCIETNLKGGSACEITYKVKPNTPFDPHNITQAIQNCPNTDIKEELYSNTGRKICKFQRIIKYNSISENDTSIVKYEPYIHNCYLPDNLGTFNVLSDIDSINYLYSDRGTPNGYDFKNGGMVRIVVTNVSIKNDAYATCSYSLYVCGQNAIAASSDETTVKIFKNIQNLDTREFYFNETIFWGVAMPLQPSTGLLTLPTAYAYVLPGPPAPVINPSNIYGYYPHPYEFNFNGTCISRGTCKEALTDAVDAGMWEWNKINYANKNVMNYFSDVNPESSYIHFSYFPESMLYDNTLSFDAKCWKNSYETDDITNRLNVDENNFINAQSEVHNFTFNFNTINENDKIKMTMGIKKLFINSTLADAIKSKYSIQDFEPRTILVMDTITFCKG